MSDLPVNIDQAYVDHPTDPSVKLHQQHHDALHLLYNSLVGSDADPIEALGLEGLPGGGGDPLLQPGSMVKLVYMTVAGSSVASDGWHYPDRTPAPPAVLADREASICWEGTAAQIPIQGTGATNFRVGDTALVRSESL